MAMKNKNTKIAVLSGKGGTGKTLVSVNLSSVAGGSIYIDCDVEEPNGHLFFKPEIFGKEGITIKMPVINESLCNGCRTCVDFCKFNALAFIKSKPHIFEEVCHSCGGCMLLCPEKAISEKEKIIGEIQIGVSGNVKVCSGIMNTGETSGIPIIKKLLHESITIEDLPVFIDCPPGSACIVMESIKDADYCILVAEPTLFGVHNLSMVHDLVNLFSKPHGVVLNKDLDGENPAEMFCMDKNIPILGHIPFDAELGALHSDAKIASRESERFKVLFTKLLETVMKEVWHETAVDPKR
jgi:MinD superfamily P-loop ATPase